MIYRFVIVSPEARSFRRDLRVGSEATFGDLRNALYDEIDYSPVEPSLIYITDHSWSRKVTIYEVEQPHSRSDEDVFLMERTRLSELLDTERQRLMLLFDPDRSRAFYIELREISSGSLPSPYVLSRSEGEPPLQRLPEEEVKKKEEPKVKSVAPEVVETGKRKLNEESTPDEYGSDAFDSTEIDPEGFGTSDESGEFDNEIPTEDFPL